MEVDVPQEPIAVMEAQGADAASSEVMVEAVDDKDKGEQGAARGSQETLDIEPGTARDTARSESRESVGQQRSAGRERPVVARPPSPYVSKLPAAPRARGTKPGRDPMHSDAIPMSSSTAAPVSLQMGRPQTSSTLLSSAYSTRSMRPLSASGSVSSQISDEPRRLLDAKVAKKRADQDYNLMLNRVKRLRLETDRSRKNMQETRTRAEEIVRLKAQNELKARAREHDRQLRESLLDRQRQQRTLMSAQRQAATRSAVERIASEKRNNVQQCRQERQLLAQQAWEARKGQEERAARIKHEIYTRERQAVHLKYRQRHMQQLRAVQQYEEKVAREEQERLRREKVLTQCIRVCLCSHLLEVGSCVGREFVSRADSAFLVVMGVTRACTCRRSSS